MTATLTVEAIHMKPDLRMPETRAAVDYLALKGYPNAHPYHVEAVEGKPCWYFYFDLPKVGKAAAGILELEVEQVRPGTYVKIMTLFTPHESN